MTISPNAFGAIVIIVMGFTIIEIAIMGSTMSY